MRDAVVDLGWEDRASGIVLAVHELVVNAIGAAGSAEISTWTENRTLVWEVADTGPGLSNPIAGYVPPDQGAGSSRGLWLARSIADDAATRASGPGTAVRLYFRERPSG